MMCNIKDLKEPIKEPQVIKLLCLNHDKKVPQTIAENSTAVSNANLLIRLAYQTCLSYTVQYLV